MMQPTTQLKEAVQGAETRLWSTYVLAMSRCQGAEAKYHNAWREYVISDCDDALRGKWRELAAAWIDATQQAQVAELAWKRATYPQHGLTVSEDVTSS